VITVSITATNYVVQSTSTDFPVTVICDNTVFTVTNQVSSFTITNVTPNISFTTDGLNGFDFAAKNKGEWVSGFTYTRNDVVYYEYSTFICSIDPLSTLVSSVNPKLDPTNWELFIHNEWPRAYLTVTNWLDVGTTASINNILITSGPSTSETQYTGMRMNNTDLTQVNRLYFNDPGFKEGVTWTGGNDWFISEAPDNLTNAAGNLQFTVGNDRVLTLNTDKNVYVPNTLFATTANIGFLETDNIEATTGTFINLNVGKTGTTGTFFINGLRFPQNKGTYGQVLFTGGDETSQAAWVNLGELVFWELSEDLKTEGFNIVSGGPNNQLTIGGGTTGNFHNSIKFNTSATSAGLIEVQGPIRFGGDYLRINGSLQVDQDARFYGDVIIADDQTLRSQDRDTFAPTLINVSTGFRFPDGTTQTSAFSLPVATTTRLGGIKVGAGLYMNDQYLNVSNATTSTLGGIYVGEYLNVSAGVLTVNTATLGPALGSLAYTLPTATDSILGGVKVGSTLNINSSTGILNADIASTSSVGVVQIGDYLNINSSTGLLSVNTATLGPALVNITLPIATTSTLGGIIVGDYLTINTSTGLMSINTATLAPALVDLAIPIASSTVLGGVKVGPNLTINSSTGILNVPLATTSTVGVVKIGSGLSIDGVGLLSLNGGNSYGNISLTEDMETNGYAIRRSATWSGVRLSLGTDQAELRGGVTGVDVTVANDAVRINTLNTSGYQIELKSPVVIAGYDIYNSKVQAGGYYNFEGTGAAFFPANVKFSDDTIQRTAWRGYDQGLI
jgi:hypothetical protein